MIRVLAIITLTTLILVSYQNCGQVTLEKVAASEMPNFSLNVKVCNFENFETKSFFAYNRNLKLEDGYYLTDTDGDGLTDEFETNSENRTFYGLNPRVRDSNLDGYDDLTVTRFNLNTDQQSSLSFCADISLDSDRDGINDCTENMIMADYRHPDSDRDGIPDRIEVLNGLNPIDSRDASLDVDGDGVLNIDEIKFGQPVLISNDKFEEIKIHSSMEVDVSTGCRTISFTNLPFYGRLDPNQFTIEIMEQNFAGETILRKVNYFIYVKDFIVGHFDINLDSDLLFDGYSSGDL